MASPAPTLEALLVANITPVVNSFGGTGLYSGPPDPVAAQTLFINQLSGAIATAVYTYLQTNVTYLAPAIPAAPAPVIPLP
jgi:hypothetical protein